MGWGRMGWVGWGDWGLVVVPTTHGGWVNVSGLLM